jgi:RNA polymerase sigma factor (sigma-70 family)
VDVSHDRPLDLAGAYRAYRPLLLGVLARLVRAGHVIPFGDGLDIVHDFFIEQYGRVAQTFDPTLGRFPTYLGAAFARFARTRAGQLRRTALLVRGVGEPAAARDDVSPTDHTAPDTQRLAEALAALPPDTWRLLYDHFVLEQSERDLARTTGQSRYEIRARLVAALGRLAVQVGESERFTAREWEVARRLWVEQRDPADIAVTLGLTLAQVKHARDQIFRKIERALGRQDSP